MMLFNQAQLKPTFNCAFDPFTKQLYLSLRYFIKDTRPAAKMSVEVYVDSIFVLLLTAFQRTNLRSKTTNQLS